MLEVRALGKRYGSRWIFRGIEFSLGKGDSLVVRGRNGAGKSTLLRSIAGLSSPTEGSVRLPEGDLRHVIGMSALDMHTYAHLTVTEHMELAARLRGIPVPEELIERIGLGDYKDKQAGQLSSGMRARLKLAMAVQARPPVLLLDEPGLSLDEHGKQALDNLCAEQRARGCLIVATNDPLERRLGNLELELAG